MKENAKTHGTGYRVLHIILCVIALIYLLLGATVSTAVRHWMQTDKLEDAIAAADIGNYQIPFADKTVAEMIQAEYVNDDLIQTSDIADAVNSIGIAEFASGKVGMYLDMLRGDTDKIVQIHTDEILPMLRDNVRLLDEKCEITVDDSDFSQLEDTLAGPLDTLNKTLDTCYGSPALRFCARFRVSIVRTLIDILLIALLLWRWTSVCVKSEKSRSRGVKGMGITMIVLSAVPFLICLISSISGLFAKDGELANAKLLKEIRAPFTVCAGAILVCGILLILFSKLPAKIAARPKKAPAEKSENPLDRTAVIPAVSTKNFCIHCGKPIKENARFCIYCGKPQSESVAENADDEDDDIDESDDTADKVSNED